MEESLGKAQADIKSLTAKLRETEAQLTAENSGAKQLVAQRDEMEKALATTQQTLTAAQAEVTRLKQQEQTQQAAQREAQSLIEDKNKQLTALTARLAEIAPRLDTAQKNQQSATQQLADLQKQLADSKQQNSDMQAKLDAQQRTQQSGIKTLQDENTALKSELAALKEVNTQPAATAAPAAIQTPLQRHSYAAGIILSEGIEKSLRLQKSLGLEVDKNALLAGVNDSIAGSRKMDTKQLNENYEALAEKMSEKEKAAYDRGFATLQSTLSGKTVLKQNQSMFFVEKKQGGAAIKNGDKLTVRLTQSRLDGKAVAPQKSFPIVYSDSIPYVLNQAITLAKKGGTVEVYCFASDMYPAEMLPSSLVGFDLLKYTFSVSK